MRSAFSPSRRSALLIAIVSPMLLGSYFKCVAVSNPSVTTAHIAELEPPALQVGEVLRVIGSGSGTPPVQFSWNFGDGTFAAGREAAHVYDAPGSYRVALTVRDGLGNSANDASQVVVSARIPSPKVGVVLLSDSIAGRPIVLSASALDADTGRHTYIWRFDDGQSLVGSEVVAMFPVPGMYVALVTVTSDLDTIAVGPFAFEVEAEH